MDIQDLGSDVQLQSRNNFVLSIILTLLLSYNIVEEWRT